MIVAITIVGMSLQDLKTTLVGKLMKLSDMLDNELDATRQRVKRGYAEMGATLPLSFAICVRSINEQVVTL
jgi:hypothetical protein